MKNLLEMFEEVCNTLRYAGIEPEDLLDADPEALDLAKKIQVLGAEQPNWPLAKTVRGFVLLPDDEAPDVDDTDSAEVDESGDESMVCWVVFNGHHPHNRSPYAPRDCWNT